MLSVQEGTNVSGLGYRYLRFLPDVRGYLPLGRLVLSARAQVGALIPVDSNGEPPPIVARFYAGGPNSMRGYGFNRLSPMVCEANSVGKCNGNWVPTGGNGLAIYSLELRFPLRGKLIGAVFGDAGYVSPSSALPQEWQQALRLANLQFAAGAGIRYVTPIGPLRIDLGARIPDHAVPHNPGDPIHHEPLVALHLIIGEAF
jgi:translocation and assembly module TamA